MTLARILCCIAAGAALAGCADTGGAGAFRSTPAIADDHPVGPTTYWDTPFYPDRNPSHRQPYWDDPYYFNPIRKVREWLPDWLGPSRPVTGEPAAPAKPAATPAGKPPASPDHTETGWSPVTGETPAGETAAVPDAQGPTELPY